MLTFAARLDRVARARVDCRRGVSWDVTHATPRLSRRRLKFGSPSDPRVSADLRVHLARAAAERRLANLREDWDALDYWEADGRYYDERERRAGLP